MSSTVEIVDVKFCDELAGRISACLCDLRRIKSTVENPTDSNLENDIDHLNMYDSVFEVRKFLVIRMEFNELAFLLGQLKKFEAASQ